jgi:hypothetical protein
MKLYLNKLQREYLLEVLRSSENNAINGKDFELALAFQELYEKIKPENVAYVKLDRGESETVLEFCEIVKSSLDKALAFTFKNESLKDSTAIDELIKQIEDTRNEIESISDQLREKIRSNS